VHIWPINERSSLYDFILSYYIFSYLSVFYFYFILTR